MQGLDGKKRKSLVREGEYPMMNTEYPMMKEKESHVSDDIAKWPLAAGRRRGRDKLRNALKDAKKDKGLSEHSSGNFASFRVFSSF